MIHQIYLYCHGLIRTSGKSLCFDLAGRNRRIITPLIMGMFFLDCTIASLHGQAAGIVIYKDYNLQEDSRSKVFEFTGKVNMGREITHYFTPTGGRIELTIMQPQSTVVYPNYMSQQLTSIDKLESVKKSVRYYRDVGTRYPGAKPFLNRHIETADEIIRRVSAGEILFNGAWMSKGEYQALVASSEEKSREFAAKIQAKKREKEEQTRRVEMEKRRHKR
jgi:hypothetical protein